MADFKVVSGVCRPQTLEALERYKSIQRETNRVLDTQGKKLLFVDGRIGSSTRNAVNTVLGSNFSDCSEIANKANTVLNQLATLARQLPVVADPDDIVRKVLSPPSSFDVETGQVVNPSVATASLGGIPLWALALVGVGGIYYFKKTQGGKKQWKSLTGGF